MDQGFVVDFTASSLIFFAGSIIPVTLFMKFKRLIILVGLVPFVSFLLTILLINIYFHVSAGFDWPMSDSFNEFHELFWILPPVVSAVIVFSWVIRQASKEE